MYDQELLQQNERNVDGRHGCEKMHCELSSGAGRRDMNCQMLRMQPHTQTHVFYQLQLVVSLSHANSLRTSLILALSSTILMFVLDLT